MLYRMLVLCLLLALAVPAVAQTDQASLATIQANAAQSRALTEDALAEPMSGISYFTSIGIGISRASDPMTTGWMAAGACLRSGTCPYTEWQNITGRTTTMQAGLLQRLATADNMTLFALGQIGAATTAESLTAVFSGGFVIAYSRPNWHGVSFVVPVKAVKVNGAEVALSVGWGLSKRF